MPSAITNLQTRLGQWFFAGLTDKTLLAQKEHHQSPWWQVMCLTGVDYFSSLAYQCGIAFLAAGTLSPLATIVLVLVTLLGATPVYRRVAEESHEGQGSIAMLEALVPGWKGKALVLCLLGFAATDFIITITLSAADGAAHIVENPNTPPILHHQMAVTMVLLAVLGAIFLKGFREAIWVAVALVFLYLGVNTVVVAAGIQHLIESPAAVNRWLEGLTTAHGSPLAMLGLSLLVFPKLALGLSGFETGVAVMPLVKGDAGDDPALPAGKIRNTKYLLTTAACIMSLFLILSSITTTLLIPPQEFAPGGKANGRALAYLAHQFLGNAFGTLYDLSTIAILWFAGASAMTGLISLVPKYLPRYGMAPGWAKATRPLVIFFTAVAFAVTLIFRASVDAQGSAYATGVLVLITSAAVATTLSAVRHGKPSRYLFGVIALIFIYTTVANCIERPEGLHIASFFIGSILLVSLVSRAARSTELRIESVLFDEAAYRFVQDAGEGGMRIVAHHPGRGTYEAIESQMRENHNLADWPLVFLEVALGDASEFEDKMLAVRGIQKGRYRVLECTSPAVPNAIAALLLHLRDTTGALPHVYMGWTEGNPVAYLFRYLFLGDGETAPVTREVLRAAEPDPKKRPRVHVV